MITKILSFTNYKKIKKKFNKEKIESGKASSEKY